MRIVYMGTPKFAVPALAGLMACGRHDVVGVVTQPDRPRGRNLQLAASPVKEQALRGGAVVLTPEKIAEAEAQIRELCPDVIAVAAYGQFIPRAIREMAGGGCINIHPSLLPKYRGAAPIQWAIRNGDAVTGVTIMHVAKVMDSGDIILQREVPINPDETSGGLETRLADIGAGMLLEAIDLIAAGNAPRTPQDESKVSHARKLAKHDGRIDWSLPAQHLFNIIRGGQPWPGAFCEAGKTLKIIRAIVENNSGQPGTIIELGTSGPLIACGEQSLRLLDVQPEGRSVMPATAWINGARLGIGDRLA